MKKRLIYIIFTLMSTLSFAQKEKFNVNNYQFLIKTEAIKNEWGGLDTIKKLYRIENKKKIYILKYYKFKDEGGDCNNLFWNKEALKIKNDSLIFTTHYFQKTNLDPIPQWRKQIYKVSTIGQLILIYDKYKFRHSNKWVSSE